MARPTKLTPELQANIVEAVAKGGYFKKACQRVGIDYSTFSYWMRKGRREGEGEFFAFFHAIKKAEAEYEHRCLERWDTHMDESWQAIATFLERRHPERWGKDRLKLEKLEERVNQLERQQSEADKAN